MAAVNSLISKPIPRLIAQLAVPASIGMFFNTMFNVVDTYFSGLISTEAVAALSLSFPVFFVILAVGFGVSTGATALIANALGAGDEHRARLYAIQSVSFSVLLSVILTLVGLWAAPALFAFLGASGSYLAIALAYINVIFLGLVFFSLNFVFNAILSAQGDTKSFPAPSCSFFQKTKLCSASVPFTCGSRPSSREVLPMAGELSHPRTIGGWAASKRMGGRWLLNLDQWGAPATGSCICHHRRRNAIFA
jgi:hypothetical protein